jgi:hypothetical protein
MTHLADFAGNVPAGAVGIKWVRTAGAGPLARDDG